MSTLTCQSCGAPLDASARSAHVVCSYCSATNVVATEQAVRVANVLERHGIRVPERPMSIAEIEAKIAARRAPEEAKRRIAVIATVVILVVVGIGIAAALALTSHLAP